MTDHAVRACYAALRMHETLSLRASCPPMQLNRAS
jgi:hypothetical protein